MFHSIRVRLTLSHLAVIVLAMALSGSLLLSFVERYFLQAMEDSLLAQARITAQALIPGALVEDAPQAGLTAAEEARLAPAFNAVQQQVGNLALQTENLSSPGDPLSLGSADLAHLADASLRLSSQLDTRIRILDAGGGVLVDSGPMDASPVSSVTTTLDPLVVAALDGEYASRIDRAGGSAVMHLALPVLIEGRLVGVVYLSQPLRDVTAVLYDLRARWLLATAIALLLSGLAGLLLSGAIARPLRRLTMAAGAVAQGRFNQQVPVGSQDELGRLSMAFNDMTARLQAARQMQVDFVANVSHELRTPLTSIKGMVETLRAGAVQDPAVRDRFLETAESETDRLIRLVNDLLLLTRADSEALNLRRGAASLPGLVQVTVDQLRPQAAEREVTLHVETSSTLPLVWIDPDRIQQVLVNLLDNAIKYSRPGGAVTVGARAGSDGFVVVQVRDRGIGIPEENLPHVGQRFYRADKARSRAGGGSGLGLAIARTLVTAHGGDLWLESQEGRGTLACFTLPPA